MQKLLEQLFNGEIYPSERIVVSTPEYKAAQRTAIQAHGDFEEKLCDAMRKELDEVYSKDSAVHSFYDEQYFVEGFRLGAQLMLEILGVGKDD